MGHEMPDVNLIHSLKISDQEISSIAINSTGDWIALGCSGLGQLLVWEWQSETYIMKQQGHFDSMSSVTYSPDGSYLATGGQDSKVKVWDTNTGFCFVTFTEHSGSITGVTFTPPKPAQFSCLAVDPSGDLVAAGSQDSFDIY